MMFPRHIWRFSIFALSTLSDTIYRDPSQHELPRSQKWRYQEFLLHQKMAKEGSKNQKKFFSEKIFERWEKQILGPLGP